MAVKVLEIILPEYQIDQEIGYDQIGEKIDTLVQSSLKDGVYVERSVGLKDHPGLTTDSLANLIIKHGTDKYDPDRKSIFDEEFSCYQFDIHASEFQIKNRVLVVDVEHDLHTYFGQNIYCFHKFAPIDRGYPVRIGVSMIYDKQYLLPPKKIRECDQQITRYSKYLYRFNGHAPHKGLKAIIKIR